jgi:hypothetical protein
MPNTGIRLDEMSRDLMQAVTARPTTHFGVQGSSGPSAPTGSSGFGAQNRPIN